MAIDVRLPLGIDNGIGRFMRLAENDMIVYDPLTARGPEDRFIVTPEQLAKLGLHINQLRVERGQNVGVPTKTLEQSLDGRPLDERGQPIIGTGNPPPSFVPMQFNQLAKLVEAGRPEFRTQMSPAEQQSVDTAIKNTKMFKETGSFGQQTAPLLSAEQAKTVSVDSTPQTQAAPSTTASAPAETMVHGRRIITSPLAPAGYGIDAETKQFVQLPAGTTLGTGAAQVSQATPPASAIDVSSLPPQYQAVYNQAKQLLGQLKARGEKLPFDVELSPEVVAGFLEQAKTELNPYWSQQFDVVKQDLESGLRKIAEMQAEQEKEIATTAQRGVRTIGEQAAAGGIALSGIRRQRERDYAEQVNEQLDRARKQAAESARAFGRSAELSLGSTAVSTVPSALLTQRRAALPGLEELQAAPGAAQTAYTPQGGLTGELERARKTSEISRAQDLESIYRGRRALDFT